MPAPDGPQDRITAFWSAVAPDYEAHGGNVPAPGSDEEAAWVAVIADLLPPAPVDVLDMGAGTGFVSLIAAELGHRVTAIDLAAPMREQLRGAAARRRVDVRCLPGDAVAPDFPPASFDAVISRHVLWTLREPDTALRNWRALLRPGGVVVAIDGFWFTSEQPDTDANADAPGFFDAHYTSDTRGALPFMALNDVRPILAAFRRAGFAEVDVQQLDAIHRLAQDPPGNAPWYAIRARG
jgi:SAM-dependent methyltransferase